MISGETHGDVTVLTLQHGKANALDTQLCRGLVAALDEVLRERSGDPAAAVVLTGRGTIFSAGVDLFRVLEGGREYLDEFLPALTGFISALVEFPRPLVAAANGHAIAGGCVMLCACDARVGAVGRGRLGVPELKVGVPFPTLALEVVKTALGQRAARDLVYGGRLLAMDEAERIGLVDRLVEPTELLEQAVADAHRLAALPPEAFALTKRQLWSGPLDRHRRHGAAWDAEVREQWADDESARRIRAYLDETVGRGKA